MDEVGRDHVERAEWWIDEATQAQDSTSVPVKIQRAQVAATIAVAEATLELAEQQRIANLIALANAERGPYRYMDGGQTHMRSEDAFGVAARMLGLGVVS